jgi:hypothetical protein
MQYVSSILGAFGGGISAYGQIQSAKVEAAAYKYNASINDANAVAERRKADYDEKQSRKKLATLMGTQRALYAKAGVDLSSGSPLFVLAETAAEGEEEAQNIRWAGDVNVAEQKNQATLNRFYAKRTVKAGKTAAWSTALSSMSGSAGSAYSTYKR